MGKRRGRVVYNTTPDTLHTHTPTTHTLNPHSTTGGIDPKDFHPGWEVEGITVPLHIGVFNETSSDDAQGQGQGDGQEGTNGNGDASAKGGSDAAKGKDGGKDAHKSTDGGDDLMPYPAEPDKSYG